MIFGVRRFPIFPTLVVLAAAAVMVMLGFWQLDRMREEQSKLARFQVTAGHTDPIAFPFQGGAETELAHYRRSSVECVSLGEWRSTAGSNSSGEAGYVQIVRCQTGGGQVADVQVGWSRDLAPPLWQGGVVNGIVAPNRDGSVLLVADPPIPAMEANKLPVPAEDQPQKNLAYAVQWFFFALTALVIYVLALRRKQQG